MALVEQIAVDLREAMKAGEKMRLATLRLLSAQIINQKIALKTEAVSDEEARKIVQREIKKRKEASEGFSAGGRINDAEREKEESKILESYLPKQMSDDDLEKIVREVVVANGAEPQNSGKLTGMAVGRVKGLAGGGRVKQMVEKILKS